MVEDDPEKAEFWLENTTRVFNELTCSPNDCLKCAISLLKDEAYQWWNTFIVVVLKDRVSWDFFQTEFRKKYKRKEFLELKQGHRAIVEHESEFFQLSKYTKECIPSKTKVEDLNKSKKKVDSDVQESSKRQLVKSFSSPSKKIK
ncbi:Hexaprenyldihydroxybenzoate methyltransferase, mitochondrial-like protein [Gossypium australe]|uniref:Hexaprenyldihydroxybenzoate methyltransferase, mitochondrial-like protein n=1 Tax=Gossypium australe TaxID=47621 RepID=A0A5B6X2D0_9ROSI|nr:Hexaprenyldihydroxybenzoate methyltransferase, mitochondrial-like protein [Gossypium australe]